METRRVGRLVKGALVTTVSGLGLVMVLFRMVQGLLGPFRYTYTPPWTAHELTMLALLVMTACGTLAGLAILRIFTARRLIGAALARRNRCGPNPVETVVTADVSRLEYANCDDGATVTLYTIRGGGHTWPGGSRRALPLMLLQGLIISVAGTCLYLRGDTKEAFVGRTTPPGVTDAQGSSRRSVKADYDAV